MARIVIGIGSQSTVTLEALEEALSPYFFRREYCVVEADLKSDDPAGKRVEDFVYFLEKNFPCADMYVGVERETPSPSKGHELGAFLKGEEFVLVYLDKQCPTLEALSDLVYTNCGMPPTHPRTEKPIVM